MPRSRRTCVDQSGTTLQQQMRRRSIDGLLMERHMAKVARRKSKNHLKGPAKRTDGDDRRFEESFRRLLQAVNGEV